MSGYYTIESSSVNSLGNENNKYQGFVKSSEANLFFSSSKVTFFGNTGGNKNKSMCTVPNFVATKNNR